MLALSEFISDSSYKTNFIQSGLFKLFNVASVWTIAKRSFQKCSVTKTWICENLLHKFCCLETGLLVTATFHNFIKKRLQHRCFPVNIGKCFGTPFLQNTSTGFFFKYVVIAKSENWKYKIKKMVFFSKLKKLRLDHDHPQDSMNLLLFR